MKKPLTIPTLAALLLTAFIAVPTVRADDTELAKQMEAIDDAAKKLRRSLKKPEQNADSLKLIGQMQAAAVASKELEPAKAAKMPEAEKAKFVAEYRREMAKVITEMVNLELAVLDNQNEKAEEILKNLKQLEESGHEKFEQGAEEEASAE